MFFIFRTTFIYHGNKFPSVPAAHAATMAESYENTIVKTQIHLENLWGFKKPCSLAWLVAWLHKGLLLSV
jgi:hypothetical protein